MLGRTHFFVGAATALIILRPETNSLLVLGEYHYHLGIYNRLINKEDI